MTNNGAGRNHLGDGHAQWQAYWYFSVFLWLTDSVNCAAAKGIFSAHPADHYNFNSHPTGSCYSLGHCIRQVIGCSVHNGSLDQLSQCTWCEYEKSSGSWHHSVPLMHKIGYYGGGSTYNTQGDALEPTTTMWRPIEVPHLQFSPIRLDPASTVDSIRPQEPVALTQSQLQQHQTEASLNVVYPVDAMNVLQNKIDMIEEMQDTYSSNFECKAGWDWLSSEAKVVNQEDISFFTGTFQNSCGQLIPGLPTNCLD